MSATTRPLSVLCLASALLFGQADANKGQIVGTVYDAKQAVVPDAKVMIRNLDTGLVRELRTDGTGAYRAIALDPGRYEIVAESGGFAPSTLSGIVLNVGSAVSADITLQVASTTTTVEVGDTLITVSPAPAAVLTNSAIQNLPINGRRFQDFAVNFPTVQVESKRNQLSFAGQRGINSNVMVDGADYNQPFFGGIRGGERSNFAFTVPQSAIQEFQVVVTGYTAEYGRSTGGVLNTITRSGSNDYHGETFYQLRHKELGAQNPFGLTSLETQHQWGGAVGGPIRRDRLFWFTAFERQDSNFPRLIQFPRLIGLAETANNREALQYFRAQEGDFDQTNDATALTAKTDYQLPAGHRLTLRYNFSDYKGINGNTAGASFDPIVNRALSNNGTEKDRTHTGGVQFTTLFGPTMVNDLRFAATYEVRPRESNSQMPTVSTTMGTFGTVSFLPNIQDDRRYQIADGFTMIRGSHTLKFGADYNRLTVYQQFGFNQFGAFSLSGSNVDQHLDILTLGGSVANRFDSSLVTYNRQIGNLLVEYGAHQFAMYAQDSWRVNRALTLDFGLRWEGQWNPTPDSNNEALLTQVRGRSFPFTPFDPTKMRDNTDQFMPRFGFAYSPFQGRRTVIRGHAGMFYAATPLILLAGPMNNWRTPPGDVSLQLPRAGSTVYKDFLNVGIDLNTFALDKLPIIDVATVQKAASFGGSVIDPYRGANLLSWAEDYQNPRAFQTGFGIDHELVRNLVVGGQFNYVNTVHLQRNRDNNLPAPAIRSTDKAQRPFFGLRSGNRRPISTLGALWVRETTARSMYRGGTLSAQYRAKRFQFGAFYTISETFSDDDQERDASGFRHENPYDLSREYSYSDLDMRHQFAGYGIANLVWGMEASTRYRFTTGQPMNPVTGADTNEDLASNDRAYEAPGVSYKRNSFRNRGFSNVDFRVLKNFRIRENMRVQFSTEFFNLFNFDNIVYGGVNARYGLGIDPATGGTVAPNVEWQRLRDPVSGLVHRDNSQIGGPQQVQFGLRFIF